jgi:tetratricopeptide (TPR) repeat protein
VKRKRNNLKPVSRQSQSSPPGGTPPSRPVATLPPGRKWLLRILAMTLPVILLVGALETALRMAGYGYRTGFFEKVRIGGKGFLVNNEKFSLRFFPPRLERWPGPVMIEASKPADTYRIFILGESAARGEPEPAFGPGRYLEILLREKFPSQKFEVVNVAITAINSHIILPIARDCARAQGDLWVIYMGNNEMVGPFGAATVFGAKAPPLPAVRLGLLVQETRTGQLFMALARKLGGKPANASWGGMKMFLGNQVKSDDLHKETVYRSFEKNLHDIVQTGLDSGAGIVLSTVAVNLKDCPPLGALPSTNLPPAQTAACEKFCADGLLSESQGNFNAAARCFGQAASLDTKRPDVQFRWAESLLRTTNYDAARDHFQRACDLDTLPFRANSRVNAIIQEAAKEQAGPRLVLCDAVSALETNNAAGICGQESFFEHVHFTFDGGYLLGRAWAEHVEALLPVAIRSRATAGWASQETCERRLGLTDWNRGAVIQTVIERLHRPPLSGQFNNAQRLAMLQSQEKKLRRRMNPATAAMARESFLEAIKLAPADHWLRENFAEFLESTHDLKEATAQWQRVCELLPRSCVPFFQAGRLLEQQDQWTQSQAALERAVALRPELTEAWYELGNVHLAQEKFEPALQDYEHARQLEPRDATYCAFTGKALSKLNRHGEAIERYHLAIQLNPSVPEVHFALADELAAANKFQDAENEYREVVRLKPGYVLGHLNLGVMLARQGRFDPAIEQFEETLRLEPENKLAREYAARVQGWKSQKH